MELKNSYLKKLLYVAPVFLGALAGYLYYAYIGCYSGSCAITSNPYISTIYGAVAGSLFVPGKLFKKTIRKESTNG